MSNIYEYIKMAIHNIMANKGRSFLTMLGIIIGIASVIAIVSIGEGTKNQMNSEINDIGGGQIAGYCSRSEIMMPLQMMSGSSRRILMQSGNWIAWKVSMFQIPISVRL